ncbi:hypothetical protein PCANB_000539 [Pneumocystis canis]|nr:hypothetical protein PCANB_000539 [Pneumocystis canis]
MNKIYQNEYNKMNSLELLEDKENKHVVNKITVKTGKKETRLPLYNGEKVMTSAYLQKNLKSSNNNIKNTISVFEEMSLKASMMKNEDICKKTRISLCHPKSSITNEKLYYHDSLEKNGKINTKKTYNIIDETKFSTKNAPIKVNTRPRISHVISYSIMPQQRNVSNTDTIKPFPTRKSLPALSSLIEKMGNKGEFHVENSNSDTCDKSLNEKFFESQGDENCGSYLNDSSSIYGNSLDSDLMYEINDLKDQLVFVTQEKSNMEKAFNEKYSILVEKNINLEGENQRQKEIIDILNKQIEEQEFLISEAKEGMEYMEKVDFLTQKVEQLNLELNELNINNKELLEQLDNSKLENEESTKVLKNEIKKSKNIIEDLEEKLKIYNVKQMDFDDYLSSINSDHMKKEKLFQDKLISIEQAMEAEKTKSFENIQKMKEELKISDSSKKEMEMKLSNALMKNNDLLKQIDNFKNNLEIVKDNYEKALEREFKEKNDICLEKFAYVEKINTKLKAINDELKNEKKKLKDKTEEYNKLYLEFSELKYKHADFQEKVLLKNEQITKHISRVKEEHEITLRSVFKEHNMIIEKLNIQQDKLSKYADVIKEKDQIIKNYEQDFKNYGLSSRN